MEYMKNYTDAMREWNDRGIGQSGRSAKSVSRAGLSVVLVGRPAELGWVKLGPPVGLVGPSFGRVGPVGRVGRSSRVHRSAQSVGSVGLVGRVDRSGKVGWVGSVGSVDRWDRVGSGWFGRSVGSTG